MPAGAGAARGRRRRAGQDADAHRAPVARGRGRHAAGGRCVSYGAGSPYGPFVELLRTWLGVEEPDTELAVRTKLRARAGALLGAAQDRALPYLGLMLSIRLEQDVERELLALSADELSDRVQDAFVAVGGGARRDAAAGAGDRRPALGRPNDPRPGRTPARADRSLRRDARRRRCGPTRVRRVGPSGSRRRRRFAHRVEELPLAPLQAEAARALIDELAPAGLVGEPVKDEVVAKAEGNPLYLEELLRALLESGGDRRRTWTITPKTARRAPAGARGAARGPHRPARTRRATARAGGRGRRTRVPGLGRRGGRGQRRRRHRRAPSRRDRARGPALPRARVHVPTRPAPGGRALDPHADLAAGVVRSRRPGDGGAPRRPDGRSAGTARVLLLPERRDRQGARVPRAGRRACGVGRGPRAGGGAVGARSTPRRAHRANGNGWSALPASSRGCTGGRPASCRSRRGPRRGTGPPKAAAGGAGGGR